MSERSLIESSKIYWLTNFNTHFSKHQNPQIMKFLLYQRGALNFKTFTILLINHKDGAEYVLTKIQNKNS